MPAPENVCGYVCRSACVWADGWTCSLVRRDIPLSVLALCHGNQTGGLWWPTGAKWGGNNAALNPTLKNDFILSSMEQFLTPRHAYACMYTHTHAHTGAYTHSHMSNWNVLWEFPCGWGVIQLTIMHFWCTFPHTEAQSQFHTQHDSCLFNFVQ